MTLADGARLGPYEIVSAVGAGGMGEVFRARDTKLNRNVAIKVLPESFATDPERLARFEREARVLASLNHPHIAAIYGFEELHGIHALVMELVEGPTLADLIRGTDLGGRTEPRPIPLHEALPIAKQIADALEAAHECGIVHRDLKPANIKVREDGTVKVLDFGLAKAMDTGPGRSGGPGVDDLTHSPTMTSPAMMTGVGMILGTAAYMSPEQARGKPVDRRADIWAFGVVLFEMLTGQRPFGGETISDTLASVLKTEPPWDALPPSTPLTLRRVLRSCLEKNPKQRLQAIGDWRLFLEDAPQPASVAVTRNRLPVAIASAAAAVFAIGLVAMSVVHFRETAPQPRAARFQIPLPEKATEPMFRLSPDGRSLAIAATEGGRSRLWVRPIDSLDARALPGADDATYPFWSPDSAFIGFFAQGKLKKIAVAGGPAQTLCVAADGRGGTWNANGVIVFSALGDALSRVPAVGGIPTPVTKAANSQRFPEFLPDGKHFLFSISLGKPEANGIYVGSLDGTPPVRLLPDESNAVYGPPDAPGKVGHLLFRRENTLMAQPFDPGRLEMTGELLPLAEQVGVSRNVAFGAFSASENGVLAYGSGNQGLRNRELVWMDRTGKRLGLIGQSGDMSTAMLSPDEKKISFGLIKQTGGTDIWLYDVVRGVSSRFTFRPGISQDGVWSPDGSRILFQSDNQSLYEKPVNGAGKEELLLRRGINTRPLDWSRDGRFLVYQMQSGGQTGYDLFLLPIRSGSAAGRADGSDDKPVPYLQTPFSEVAAQFSPDGRWMAYTSNESGRPQIYVQGIPASGAKWQISAAGGDQPRWRRDGKELFFISDDQKLMVVPVKTGAAFEAGAPQPLFDIQPINNQLSGRFAYQPTADGQRFLVTAPAGGQTTPLTVVLNWQAGLVK